MVLKNHLQIFKLTTWIYTCLGILLISCGSQVRSQELYEPANEVFLPIVVGESRVLEDRISKDFSSEERLPIPIAINSFAFEFNSNRNLLASLSVNRTLGGHTITFWDKWTAYEATGKNFGLNYAGKLEYSDAITIHQFALAPDDRRLVTLDIIDDPPSWSTSTVGDPRFSGNQISVWDVDKRQFLFSCAQQETAVAHMGFVGNSRILISATKAGIVRLWRLRHSNCQQIHELDLGTTIETAAVSTDGKRIAIATQDSTIHLLDSELRIQKQLTHPSVEALFFSPNGKTLLSFGILHEPQDDEPWLIPQTLKIWDSNNEVVAEIVPQDHGIKRICSSLDDLNFLPDSQTFIFAPNCGSLFQWDIEGNLRQTFTQRQSEHNHVSHLSADGQWLANGSLFGFVTIWDVGTGKRLFILSGHQESITDINFFADKEFLVTASTDFTTRVWQLSDGNIFGFEYAK